MNKFIFIVGAVAAGKTTFMEKKIYNVDKNECNFFDQDQAKLMIQLYSKDKTAVNDLTLANALKKDIQKRKNFLRKLENE